MNKLELYNGFYQKNWQNMGEVFDKALNTSELDKFYNPAIFEVSIANELFPYSNLGRTLGGSYGFVKSLVHKISAKNEVGFDFDDLISYSMGFDLNSCLDYMTKRGIGDADQRLVAEYNKHVRLPYLLNDLGFVKDEIWEDGIFKEYTLNYKDSAITIKSDCIVLSDIIFEYGETKFEEFSKSKMSAFFRKSLKEQFNRSHYFKSVNPAFGGSKDNDDYPKSKISISVTDKNISYMDALIKDDCSTDELISALTEFRKDIQNCHKEYNNPEVISHLLHQMKITYCAFASLALKDNSYIAYARLAKCARAIRVLNTKLFPL